MIVFAIFFTLIQPLISGMEITRVRLFDDVTYGVPEELEVEEGARLRIPCMFFVRDPDYDSCISLEWGIRNPKEDSFTPIIRLQDTMMLPVKHPNRRAWIQINLVRQGRCSLTIDAAMQEDSGLYELHLSVDDLPFLYPVQISVRVIEKQLKGNFLS